MSKITLDSSALLAVIGMERGAELVVDLMSAGEPVMSAVNLAEVVTRLIDRGLSLSGIQGELDDFGITVHPFNEADAFEAGRLRTLTRAAGLSLGDRACIALASRLGTPAVTGDRAWATVALPVEVILIRPE